MAFFCQDAPPFNFNYLPRGQQCCWCLVDTNWPKVKRAFSVRQTAEGSAMRWVMANRDKDENNDGEQSVPIICVETVA